MLQSRTTSLVRCFACKLASKLLLQGHEFPPKLTVMAYYGNLLAFHDFPHASVQLCYFCYPVRTSKVAVATEFSGALRLELKVVETALRPKIATVV